MAMSAAERSKKYRENRKKDPQRLSSHKEKDRKRKRENYVPIAERSQREQRLQRRRWKGYSKSYREKKRCEYDVEPLSPPPTPDNLAPPMAMAMPLIQPAPDQRRKRGWKKVKKSRAKAYRRINMLERQLDTKLKLLERWKKRYYREKEGNSTNSPRSRASKLLKGCKVPPEVRKQLAFNNAVVDEIRQKYIENRKNKTKQAIRRSVASVQMKYRMLNHLSSATGISRWLLAKDRAKSLGKYDRKKMSSRIISDSTKQKICKFLERDESSRQLPGKKDTVTFQKIKKQKRLLNDSMTNLYAKFTFENPSIKIGYSTFCRYKPFWIVKPTLKDVDTCMCKKCTNIGYINRKLVAEKVISGQPSDNLAELVCDTKNKRCMYDECPRCKGKQIAFNLQEKGEKKITYQQWVTKEKSYGNDKTSKVTCKDEIPISLSELCTKYESELKPRISKHMYNIHHQYAELKKLKEGLQPNEVMLHVDFSENYGCKSGEEIQSAHFGGSHSQISLHTGVYYLANDVTTSFCTISSCTRHDPSGIWGHMTPILRKIREEHPSVNNVHFVSDGPTTQYRNKTNIWLAGNIPRSLGFTKITWNFLEAGHGKGAPDGIGGVIKRTADTLVTHGGDIETAEACLTHYNNEPKSMCN